MGLRTAIAKKAHRWAIFISVAREKNPWDFGLAKTLDKDVWYANIDVIQVITILCVK